MKKIRLIAVLAAVAMLSGCSGSEENPFRGKTESQSDSDDWSSADNGYSSLGDTYSSDNTSSEWNDTSSSSNDTSSEWYDDTTEWGDDFSYTWEATWDSPTAEPDSGISSPGIRTDGTGEEYYTGEAESGAPVEFSKQKNTAIGELQPAEWIGKTVGTFEYAYGTELARGDYFAGSTKLVYPRGFDTGFTLMTYPLLNDDLSEDTITGIICYSDVRPGLELYNGIRSAASWNELSAVLPSDARIYEPQQDDVEGTYNYSASAYFNGFKLIAMWGAEYTDDTPCNWLVICQE